MFGDAECAFAPAGGEGGEAESAFAPAWGVCFLGLPPRLPAADLARLTSSFLFMFWSSDEEKKKEWSFVNRKRLKSSTTARTRAASTRSS